MKSFKKILGLLLICLLGFVFYTLFSTGFFRSITNTFNGTVYQQIAIAGAEDISINTTEEFALISATDRKAIPRMEAEHGGLYYMNLKTPQFKPLLLTATFKKQFAPHGLSFLKKDSTYTVMVVNHTLEGHSIEAFSLSDSTLTHQRTFTDKSMISPNDIVLIDENRFYFTNDHGYTEGLGKLLEEYGGLAASNVIYYDGEKYIEVAKNIAYANGINYDRSRNLLYVASPRKFLVKVFSINADGTLAFIEDIDCGTGVDNIELDKDGNLWIGAHPNLIRFSQYAKGQKATAPSEIIKISYKGKNDYSIQQLYLDDGNGMSGASVATPFKDFIITGNVMDNSFLVLKTQH